MFAELLLVLTVLTKCYGNAPDLKNDTVSFTYNAAVVEYHAIHNASMSYEENLNFTVHDYIGILEEIEEDLDIVLFPEATLTPLRLPLETKKMTEVPEPFSENLCNSSNSKYLYFLKQLSCAAVNKGTTVVINLIEKSNCTLNNMNGFCPTTGFVYYNSDVVLNKEGSVSARYRKYNLFGEHGLSPPVDVEIVNFTTKNNDSFGIFTCFDILFQKPALILPKIGIRNILFPTMWFSELPYLTALQVQQMWAQENNVTVLGSGANNPREGSGGSGIFVGYKGPLNYTILGGQGGVQILIQRVPKIQLTDNPYMNKIFPLNEDIDNLANGLDDFHLTQDPSILSGHTSMLLNTNFTEINEKVCNGDAQKICCQFHIKMKSEDSFAEDKNIYTYHLAAFSGVRSFGGVRYGGIETCAVFACLNSSINSCGKRFSKYSTIHWPVTFEQINVSAEFEISDDRIQFPNSLLASLRSISPQYTKWIRKDLKHALRRDHILNTPHNKLLTFGIFGRDFSRDRLDPSGSEVIASNNITTILLLIISVLVIFYKI